MRPRKKVSSAGIELIESFEGLRRKAARLPDGRWTIGYGHTQSAREGLEVTAEDARLLLIWDLRPVEAIVEALVVTPLNQNQFDAIVAFAFNIGMDAFKDSDVLKLVNEGRFTQAAGALDQWRKADIDGDPLALDALIRRRAAEKDLFLAPVAGEAPVVVPTPRVEPEAQAEEPVAEPLAEPHTETDLDAHAETAGETRAEDASLAAPTVAAAAATVVHPDTPAEAVAAPANEDHGPAALDAEPNAHPLTVEAEAVDAAPADASLTEEAPVEAVQVEEALIEETLAEASLSETPQVETLSTEAAPIQASDEVVVPLLAPPAASVLASQTLVPTAEPEHDEVLTPSPSSWGVEAGQVSAMAVAVAWPQLAATAEPVAEVEAEDAAEPVLEPEAAPSIEPQAEPEAPVAAEAVEVEASSPPSAEVVPVAEAETSAVQPAPAPVTAEPVAPPESRPTPAPEPPLESVFASYGPMAFAVLPRKPRPSEPASAPAPVAEEAGETADPEPRSATPAETASVAPAVTPATPQAPTFRAAPTERAFAPARSVASSFGPMFVPETRSLSEIAPAPAVLAAAPEPQPLVLTSPPADWDDARYGGAPTITALSPEMDELETPLFDEGWDAPSALSSRVVRNEMTEEFTPPRGIRFGVTGPWILLGVVGFAANGGALYGLMQGRSANLAGSHDGHALVLALGVIGVACICTSGYFLFKRLGGAED